MILRKLQGHFSGLAFSQSVFIALTQFNNTDHVYVFEDAFSDPVVIHCTFKVMLVHLSSCSKLIKITGFPFCKAGKLKTSLWTWTERVSNILDQEEIKLDESVLSLCEKTVEKDEAFLSTEGLLKRDQHLFSQNCRMVSPDERYKVTIREKSLSVKDKRLSKTYEINYKHWGRHDYTNMHLVSSFFLKSSLTLYTVHDECSVNAWCLNPSAKAKLLAFAYCLEKRGVECSEIAGLLERCLD